MPPDSIQREHLHFVTGRLAADPLRKVVTELATELGFEYSIDVLPITVAALMTPDWIAQRINVPTAATKIVIPGYCTGDLAGLEAVAGRPVEQGPRDFRRLAAYFGRTPPPADFGAFDVEIVAEINHCPRLTCEEILETARQLASDGADVIDVGCNPGGTWAGVAEIVRELCHHGHRVSIDSLNPREIEAAVRAGAQLVLSVNSSNRRAATDWGAEVVAIPDDPKSLDGLDETVDFLAKSGVPLRIDPVLEPIGFGFAESIQRFFEIRRRYPDAEILMGIGNLTELTDADSAPINTILLGICQELGVRSVLTTQVINWTRSCVRECDLARRLMYHAVRSGVLPKHVEPRLVLLRDEAVAAPTVETLEQLAHDIKDHNYRIFVVGEQIHVVSAGIHLFDSDPFVIMEKLIRSRPDGKVARSLSTSHAFYLGFEMCKALTAATLSKQYQQDEPLDWGFLTRQERHHYLRDSSPDHV